MKNLIKAGIILLMLIVLNPGIASAQSCYLDSDLPVPLPSVLDENDPTLDTYLPLNNSLTNSGNGTATFSSGNPVYEGGVNIGFEDSFYAAGIRAITGQRYYNFWVSPPESGTVSMWIKMNALNSGASNSPRIFGASNTFECFLGWGGNIIQCDLGGAASLNSNLNLEAEKWYHLTVTWDSVNSSQNMWLDGVLINSNNSSNRPSGGQYMLVGNSYSGNGQPWNGSIDEVAFYTRALSECEIQKLALGPNACEEPCTECAYVSAVNEWSFCQSGIQYATDVEYSTAYDQNMCVDVPVTRTCASQNQCYDPNASTTKKPLSHTYGLNMEGLVAYYEFNGNFNDSKGNNHASNSGVTFSSANNVDSSFDNSAYFNGYSNLGIPDSDELDFADGKFSNCLWYKKENAGYPHVQLISKRHNWYGGYELQINSGPYLVGGIYGFGVTAAVDPGDNKWVHTCYTQDSGVGKLYVDGDLVSTNSAITGGLTTLNNHPIAIGRDFYCSTDDWGNCRFSFYRAYEYFKGYMDDLSFFNRALSDCEIKSLYLGVDACANYCESCHDNVTTPNTIEINSCQTLSQANTTYKLTGDIIVNNASQATNHNGFLTCLPLTAKDVVLDCNGYSITNNLPAVRMGISSYVSPMPGSLNTLNPFSKLTLRNCDISGFTEYDIYGNGGAMPSAHNNNTGGAGLSVTMFGSNVGKIQLNGRDAGNGGGYGGHGGMLELSNSTVSSFTSIGGNAHTGTEWGSPDVAGNGGNVYINNSTVGSTSLAGGGVVVGNNHNGIAGSPGQIIDWPCIDCYNPEDRFRLTNSGTSWHNADAACKADHGPDWEFATIDNDDESYFLTAKDGNPLFSGFIIKNPPANSEPFIGQVSYAELYSTSVGWPEPYKSALVTTAHGNLYLYSDIPRASNWAPGLCVNTALDPQRPECSIEPEEGMCGFAHNKYAPTKPTAPTSLCSSGQATVVTENTDGTFTWSCNGVPISEGGSDCNTIKNPLEGGSITCSPKGPLNARNNVTFHVLYEDFNYDHLDLDDLDISWSGELGDGGENQTYTINNLEDYDDGHYEVKVEVKYYDITHEAYCGLDIDGEDNPKVTIFRIPDITFEIPTRIANDAKSCVARWNIDFGGGNTPTTCRIVNEFDQQEGGNIGPYTNTQGGTENVRAGNSYKLKCTIDGLEDEIDSGTPLICVDPNITER